MPALFGKDRAPSGTTRRGRPEWLEILGRAARTRQGAIGLALAGFVVLLALMGPFVAPHSPTAFVVAAFSTPSKSALLGGDYLGRDVLSRVLAGGWLVLIMAVAATALGLVVGTIAGVSAGYLRSWQDASIMRTVDVILAFPAMVFALLLVSLAGPRMWLVVLAVGLTHAPAVARVVRGATLDVSERDFVKAAELSGTPAWRVMSHEMLPNLISPLMVEAGLRLTTSIIIIAGLAFLGFGQAPPAANWGIMINENRIGLVSNPWPVLVPVMLIAILTIGTNLFTDAVSGVALGSFGEANEENGELDRDVQGREVW